MTDNMKILHFDNLDDMLHYLFPNPAEGTDRIEQASPADERKPSEPFVFAARFKHVGSGEDYILLDEAHNEVDMKPVFLYMSCSTSAKFVRDAFEFCDGRFLPLNDLAIAIMQRVQEFRFNHG